MRGRPPIPTEVKKKRGNPGRRPLNKTEPSAGKNAPNKPSDLPAKAGELWDQMVKILGDMEVLDVADGLTLEMLCRTYAEWRKSQDVIDKNGGVYASTNREGQKVFRRLPHVAHASDCWKRLRSLIGEFGLSPSSRVRLGSQDGEDAEFKSLMEALNN